MVFFVYNMHIYCYMKTLILLISDHNLEQSGLVEVVIYEKVDK